MGLSFLKGDMFTCRVTAGEVPVDPVNCRGTIGELPPNPVGRVEDPTEPLRAEGVGGRGFGVPCGNTGGMEFFREFLPEFGQRSIGALEFVREFLAEFVAEFLPEFLPEFLVGSVTTFGFDVSESGAELLMGPFWKLDPVVEERLNMVISSSKLRCFVLVLFFFPHFN